MEPRRSFRFLKELSEGAFGKVYLAEMITGDNFKSVVAIKLLHGKWAEHEEIVQRSRDEARVLGLLHHRNIIRVEDLTSINGQCAIVMEYLDGVDLKTLVNGVREQGDIVPRKVVFDVAAQVASALEVAYYHKPLQGGEPLRLIHRDIKPSNVMLTRAGDVKVLDFGTAQARFDHREAHTQALAFGSAAYMAPERLLGDPDDPSGDIFSLGVTVYEMLALKSFGKIHIRPEEFDKKLERRIDELELDDLDEERAEQVRETMRLLLAYDAEDRPDTGQVVDLLEALAESIHDGSMRRFCRKVVAPMRDTMEPDQDPSDPLTGSTLFEDVSNFSSLVDEADTGEFRAALAERQERASQTWIDEPEESGPYAADGGPQDDDLSSSDALDAGTLAGQEEVSVATAAEDASDAPSGSAQVKIDGATPGPSLQMPDRPSFATGEFPAQGAHEQAADQVAVEIEDDEQSLDAPSVDERSAPRASQDSAPQSGTTSGASPVDAPATSSDARPADAPATSSDARPADPSNSGARTSGAGSVPPRPPGGGLSPQSAPDIPPEQNLFTAPTVQLGGRDEDDIYGEYADEPSAPRTAADARQAAAPSPAPSPQPTRRSKGDNGVTYASARNAEADDASSSGGGGLKILLLAGLVLLLLGGGAAAVVISGVLDGPEPEPVPTTSTDAGADDTEFKPGRTVRVTKDGELPTTARLKVEPEGAVNMTVIASGRGTWDWDGTGVMTLQGVEKTGLRAKVELPDGDTLRTSFDVPQGANCMLRFDAQGNQDWETVSCE